MKNKPRIFLIVFAFFIVYGNLSKEEKIDFITDIKDKINVVVIVLDKNKFLKCWNNFKVVVTKYKIPNYEKTYIQFIDALEGIL